MKKLIFSALFLFGTGLIGGTAVAASGYGDAGCGLGAVIMGPQKGWTQVFAATSNGTSGNQTFGITSGTSNCTSSGAVAVEKQVPHYVEVNRFALAKEAARGGGETVSGLANLIGCDNAVLGKNMQKNYDRLFVETNMEPAKIEQGVRNNCGA